MSTTKQRQKLTRLIAQALRCRYYRNGECTAGPFTCGITDGRYTKCSDWWPKK